MSVLAAKGIRKSYGGMEVVAGLDFELERGECYGLLGPNGAGKTTTLRMLLGQWPEAPVFHIAVLLAYGIGGIYIALVLFRRRLLG